VEESNCGRELKSICMTRKTEDWHFGTNESKYAEAIFAG
jgi:hypothetical protein